MGEFIHVAEPWGNAYAEAAAIVEKHEIKES